MQFDPVVTLGTLFQIATLIAIGGMAYQRIVSIEKTLEGFSKRVETVERTLLDQAAALNRLIGRQEARDERDERRHHGSVQ